MSPIAFSLQVFMAGRLFPYRDYLNLSPSSSCTPQTLPPCWSVCKTLLLNSTLYDKGAELPCHFSIREPHPPSPSFSVFSYFLHFLLHESVFGVRWDTVLSLFSKLSMTIQFCIGFLKLFHNSNKNCIKSLVIMAPEFPLLVAVP